MSTSRLVERLAQSVRRGRVLHAPAQLAGYDADGLGYKTFRPEAVAIPADVDELAALVRDAQHWGVPVTMRGAGTSLSGGPVAAQGGVVIHTSSLKRVRHVDRAGQWCEVECSVVLNQLDATLAPYGLFYPPDPSSGPVCTLGGNVAMNAGGAHCFRYGVTSNYVLGVEAVLLDGSRVQWGGPAGGRGDWREDWKRLMVGSEGTLAAFTRFWLRLLPRPEKCWTYRATFPDLHSAERAIHALSAHAAFPVAIELMDPRCVAMVENSPMAVGLPKDAFLIVTEIDGPATLVDARATDVARTLREAGALTVDASDDESVRKGLWKARKVAGGLMGQLSPDFLVQDAVIPKRALAEVLQLVYDEGDAAGLPAVNVFHAGDGNLHPNFLFDSRKHGELEKVEAISKRLMQRVVEVGGTLSGEHGIGNDKAAYMPLVFGESTLRMQLAVPKIFNPRHQMNPLKVFQSRSFDDARTPRRASAEDGHPQEKSSFVTSRRVGFTGPEVSALFAHYLDEIDGTLCGPVSMTPAELASRLQGTRWRFPLWLAPHATMVDQVKASGYSPASSRFGPWCDNLLGMNWRLPSGRVVRVGERVVKSTTGYDLFRFLLHSSGRLGEPVDFVVRLRSDCGVSGVFKVTGGRAQVAAVAQSLVSSCWLHWFDAIDLLDNGAEDRVTLRLALNCPAEEWDVYQSQVARLAASERLEVQVDRSAGLMAEGCPDFVLKTTADRAPQVSREVRRMADVDCVVLLYPAVVHGYFRPNLNVEQQRAQVESIVARFQDELWSRGGDWGSRHLPPSAPGTREADWLRVLEEEFAVA